MNEYQGWGLIVIIASALAGCAYFFQKLLRYFVDDAFSRIISIYLFSVVFILLGTKVYYEVVPAERTIHLLSRSPIKIRSEHTLGATYLAENAWYVSLIGALIFCLVIELIIYINKIPKLAAALTSIWALASSLFFSIFGSCFIVGISIVSWEKASLDTGLEFLTLKQVGLYFLVFGCVVAFLIVWYRFLSKYFWRLSFSRNGMREKRRRLALSRAEQHPSPTTNK